MLRATTACTFSTSQLPKVVRSWWVLHILTWKCASRHNGVHFFDIATSKRGPTMVCFVHFDLEMCFAPQRRALFRHLNFQKWSENGVFCTFWLPCKAAPQSCSLKLLPGAVPRYYSPKLRPKLFSKIDSPKPFCKAAPESCSPKLLPKAAVLQSCRAKLLLKAVPQGCSPKLFPSAAPQSCAQSCSPKLVPQSCGKLLPKVAAENCSPKLRSKATPHMCSPKHGFFKAAVQSCSSKLLRKTVPRRYSPKLRPKLFSKVIVPKLRF